MFQKEHYSKYFQKILAAIWTYNIVTSSHQVNYMIKNIFDRKRMQDALWVSFHFHVTICFQETGTVP